MRFSSKVFLLAFVPTTVLLLAGFWTLQELISARVSDQIGVSLRQTHEFVAQMRETYELQSGTVATTVADNSALKAGFELVELEENSPAAQLTLEDQLLITATDLGFDLIGAANADGEPIGASIGDDRTLTKLPLAQLVGLEAGLVALRDTTYFVNRTPVNLGSDFLGTIIVGREFSLSEFSSPMILTRGERVLKSNLAGSEVEALEAGLAACQASSDCEIALGSEHFLLVSLDDLKLGEGFQLRSLQSVELAVAPIEAVLARVFLIVGSIVVFSGLIVSWLASRSVVRPLASLVDDMRTRLASTTYAASTVIRRRDDDELAALIGASNEMLDQIENHEAHLERQVEIRTAELESTNAELIVARDQAEEGNRLKSHFLANMSHEIRTPLSVVIGMTELAYEAASDPKQRNHLRMAQESGLALLTIVDDVLDFSKIEGGTIEMKSAEFDVRETLAQIVKMLAAKATEKGLTLSHEVSSDLPERIIGDEGRLKQVLVNLVGNAIKFSDEGGARIHAELEEGSENSIHYIVTDSGIGVAPEMQKEIFERFRQVDGSSTRRYGGTGLGLAISSQLIEAMGGRMWIESELGKGSAFHFTVQFEMPAQMPQSGGIPHRVQHSAARSAGDGSI